MSFIQLHATKLVLPTSLSASIDKQCTSAEFLFLFSKNKKFTKNFLVQIVFNLCVGLVYVNTAGVR